MNRSFLLIAAAFTFATAAPDRTDAKPNSRPAITLLKEPYMGKSQWKDSGFKTPQTAVQTFLWAMREGDWKRIRSCFAPPDDKPVGEDDVENLKKAAESAKGFQALAIQEHKDGTVELKFKVTGWDEEPMVHGLKNANGVWKLFGNTRTADW